MSWSPVTGLPINFREDASGTAASDHYLKFYISGDTTPTPMATDATGATTLAKAQFNALGYCVNGSNDVFIPHIDRKYRAVLYPDATTADNNTFGSAVWDVDGITPVGGISAPRDLTEAEMIADTTLVAGDVVIVSDRASSTWDISASGTANGYNVIALTGSGLYATLRIGSIVSFDEWGMVANSSGAGANNKLAFEHLIAYATDTGVEIQFPQKPYHILGDVDLASYTGGQQHPLKIVGRKSKGDTQTGSVLYFSSYVSGQTRGLYFSKNMVSVHLEGFTVRGAGSSTLNDASAVVDGLNDVGSSNSNGLTMIDVAFRGWSGDGVNIIYWFQQRWISCYARDCGQWGIIIDGDQAPLFDMTGGAFFRNCGVGGGGEGALWIKRGNAIVRGWNGEDLDMGLKCGDGSAKRVRLDISGGNFEQMNSGSTGILIDDYSQVNSMYGVQVQGPETAAATMLYAIHFKRLNGLNRLQDFRAIWFATSNGDGIDVPIRIDAAESGAVLELPQSRDDLVTMGYGTTTLVQGAARTAAIKQRGNVFGDKYVEMESGLYNKGVVYIDSIIHKHSVGGATLDLSAGFTKEIYYLDADTGNISVTLPTQAATISQDLTATFKRIDATGNTVTMNTVSTQTIDGVDNPTLASMQVMRINKPADGVAWYIIN